MKINVAAMKRDNELNATNINTTENIDMNDLRTENEETEEKPGLKTLWREFASNTTAHGFSQLIISSNGFMKCFWIADIIGCQVLLYLQIYPLVVRYLERPTRTKFVLQDDSSQLFPMITFCNTNIIKQSMLEDLKNTSYFQSKTHLLAKRQRRRRETKTEAVWTSNVTEEESDFDRDESSFQDYITQSDILRGLGILAFDKGEDVFKYGHQFYETVTGCYWDDYYDCGDDQLWDPVWHWKYGSCYTFNMGNKQRSAVSVTGIGPHKGLELRLRLNQDEYLNNSLTDTAAIILHVGEQGSLIQPHEDGISIAPDYAYYIGLQKKRIKRADPFKNKTCIPHSKVDLGVRSFSNRIITKYSIQGCEEICIAQDQIKECGCSSYWLPSLNANRTCSSDDDTCADELLYAPEDSLCMKNCRFPCDETKYEMETSFRKFPRRISMPKDDELRVTIYFKTLETQWIQDERHYFIENLLGDIGGQLGLFSGVSALTVVELIFMLGNMVVFIGITTKYLINKHIKSQSK